MCEQYVQSQGLQPQLGFLAHTCPCCIATTKSSRNSLMSLNPQWSCAMIGRLLWDLATELTPAFNNLFTQTYEIRQLPRNWATAWIYLVFKKGPWSAAENYRPVSLMFVACKVMELLIAQTSDPENHGFLTPANHGLRREHWCRTQLVTTHDITKCLDHREQGDMAVFDFNKAFDNIPHQHLLSNLEFCGITGKTQNWIDAFLVSRTQSMTMEGHCSRGDYVEPGVLQGPLLFLIFVSDLPNIVHPIRWSTCLPMTMSSTTQSEARWINSSYITTSTPFTGGDNAVVCRICSSTPRNVISWGLEMWLEQWQFKLDLILLVDNVMQSTDIYWTVTQILVPPVYIIATSQVCNHWLQAMFTWHWAFGSWLYLHLKINQQQQVVQIRIQVSHVDAVLELWSLQTSVMVATHAEHKINTFCWQFTFLHNSTMGIGKLPLHRRECSFHLLSSSTLLAISELPDMNYVKFKKLMPYGTFSLAGLN